MRIFVDSIDKMINITILPIRKSVEIVGIRKNLLTNDPMTLRIRLTWPQKVHNRNFMVRNFNPVPLPSNKIELLTFHETVKIKK